MSREKSLFKNTIILAIGTFLPRLLSLGTMPIITASVSTSNYGYMDLITSTILSLIVPVATLQLEQGLFRFLIDAKNEDERKTIITSGYALIAFIMLVIGVICFFIPLKGFNGIYKLLLIGYIWIEIASQMSRFVLRAFSMYKQYSIFAAIAVVVNFVVIALCLLVLKTGYMGILISLAVADVVGLLYVLFTCKMFHYFDMKYYDKDVMKEMLTYSVPFVPNMISWYVNQLADRWIIVAFLGEAANGIYGVAYKIPAIVNLLYPAFNMAWTESAARSVGDEDSGAYYNKMFKMLFCIISAGTALLLAVSPFLFAILVRGKGFQSAYNYTPTLIIGTYFYCFAQFFSSIYIAVKSGKSMSISTTIAAIINVVINLVLIRFIGIQAAVLATLISNFALAAYRYFDINKRYYKLRISGRLIVLTTIVMIIEMILCWSGNNILLMINLLFAFVYAYFIAGDIIIGMIKPILRRKSNG